MKRAVTLKENYEFRRLYKKGDSAVDRCMVVYCRKNNLGRNRFGFVSSVKLGNAVVRNRCRRRLREVSRLNADRLAVGYDIILVARTRTVSGPFSELMTAYVRLAKKLSLLKKEEA